MTKTKEKPLPVIVRVVGKRTKSPAHVGDVVVIFPSVAGTYDPNTMTCYSAIGQHSACSSGYIDSKTRPATAEETARMLEHLRYYTRHDNVNVVKRPSPHHRAERIRQIERLP